MVFAVRFYQQLGNEQYLDKFVSIYVNKFVKHFCVGRGVREEVLYTLDSIAEIELTGIIFM